jgi:Protein of unknown function (DUF1360)
VSLCAIAGGARANALQLAPRPGGGARPARPRLAARGAGTTVDVAVDGADTPAGLQERPPFEGYSEEDRPLGSYGALIAAFGTIFTVGALAGARRRGDLPERISPSDVVMAGVATHKLSRLLAKDKVTSIIRAPFTRHQGSGGPAEVEEEPRGRGVRYALGELLVCPFCLSQWVAGAFACGLVLAPRSTRLVAATFDMVALSDFLQVAYKAGEERMEG